MESKIIPVLFNEDKYHVLARADISREPDNVVITITASGPESQLLAEFLQQADPFALSIGAFPVQNIREKRERN